MPPSPSAKVIVVGLGPSDERYLTTAAAAALDAAAVVYVRTARHPAAQALLPKGAQSCDRHYEEAEQFAEVYRRIVDELVQAAQRHGEIVYAVPGSPFVLEDTVMLLLDDDRVRTEVIPGLSFVDLCWQRLRIDPMQRHVRLIDATSFSKDAMFDHGPLLIGQLYSQAIASQVKLAVENPPTSAVTVLRHLGSDDESVEEIAWEDLDRVAGIDHLCCVYVPHLDEAVGEELGRTIEVVTTLRAQCPWDQVQTHTSLARHLIEETYEAVEAIDELSDPAVTDAVEHLEEELGDLLCQVLFHAVIASEEGYFSLADIAQTLREKLVRRHPHVFGDVSDVSNPETVLSRWEQIKQQEKKRASLMDGMPSALPALTYAMKIERKLRGVQLGHEQFSAEEKALLTVLEAESSDEDQVGAALLAIARRAAANGVDPEAALRRAARRLRDRFMDFEREVTANGAKFADLDPTELRALFPA